MISGCTARPPPWFGPVVAPVPDMRLSSTELRASHEEARALYGLLERIDQLLLSYDDSLMNTVAPWVERAREAITHKVPARELKTVRLGLEQAVAEVASERADAVIAGFEAHLDALLRRSGLLTIRPADLVAILIDPLSPDVPLELHAGTWPVTVETAQKLAEDLRETAPETADWLLGECAPDEHRVVAFTFGRIMRTTRRLPSYADA